jgi:hypothetical protein
MIPEVQSRHGALVFSSGMVVDADGAPNAYAPAGTGLAALDYLANAMNGDKFVGVVCIGGVPVVQRAGNPCPGYYVSPTSLVDRSKIITDPRRYVNADVVSYVAVCPELRSRGVQLGDLAMVLYKDKRVAAIVADVSPHDHYGEASVACARAVGIPSSAKNGGVAAAVTYVLFPGSLAAPAWPREFAADAEALYLKWKAAEESLVG